MGERVVVDIVIPEGRRRVHAVMAGKDGQGKYPDYQKDTVVLHLGSGGYMIRAPHSNPSFYREDEIAVSPEVVVSKE